MAAVGKAGGQGDASGSVLLNWHEKVSHQRECQMPSVQSNIIVRRPIEWRSQADMVAD
jgi:hypothetical protein